MICFSKASSSPAWSYIGSEFCIAGVTRISYSQINIPRWYEKPRTLVPPSCTEGLRESHPLNIIEEGRKYHILRKSLHHISFSV